MRKDEWMGITVAFMVTLVLILLSNWQKYVELMKNPLGIILMLFAMCTIFGIGTANLFDSLGKDKKSKGQKEGEKSDVFK